MKAAPARRVIHAGTRIQVVLAVVDASGNVIENRPVRRDDLDSCVEVGG